MNKSQSLAWKVLTDEEKTSLTLSLSSGKSTWEAGEIMGKAHYKYLEIRQRAEKFMVLFTDFFELYPSIIPLHSILDKDFKKYLRFTMEQRLTPKESISKLDNPLYLKLKTRYEEISREVQSLKGSKFASDQNLYHLIMDFDRWNNFRILPPHLQEPSAFKRRNKHKLRKLVNLFTSLDPLSILKIKQLYEVKRPDLVKDYLFLPLVTVHDPSLTQIIRVVNNDKNLRQINTLILYAFRSEEESKRYLDILDDYIKKDYKHCRDGQRFWPEFRILTQKAINFHDIQNISPTRKYIQDTASKDHDLIWLMSAKLKK